MLFNSVPFILGFLPTTVIGFFILGLRYPAAALLWLACASLSFYGWWRVSFVPLLVGSVLFNYGAPSIIVNDLRKGRNNWPKLARVSSVGAAARKAGGCGRCGI